MFSTFVKVLYIMSARTAGHKIFKQHVSFTYTVWIIKPIYAPHGCSFIYLTFSAMFSFTVVQMCPSSLPLGFFLQRLPQVMIDLNNLTTLCRSASLTPANIICSSATFILRSRLLPLRSFGSTSLRPSSSSGTCLISQLRTL